MFRLVTALKSLILLNQSLTFSLGSGSCRLRSCSWASVSLRSNDTTLLPNLLIIGEVSPDAMVGEGLQEPAPGRRTPNPSTFFQAGREFTFPFLRAVWMSAQGLSADHGPPGFWWFTKLRCTHRPRWEHRPCFCPQDPLHRAWGRLPARGCAPSF